MAAYKLEVIRRGYIIVDDVEDLIHAEEYIENCNPVDEVHWSDFLETTPCGTELEVVYIPDFLQVKKLAEILEVSSGEILRQLFMDGKVANADTLISFETVENIGRKYDVLFK